MPPPYLFLFILKRSLLGLIDLHLWASFHESKALQPNRVYGLVAWSIKKSAAEA
jgi:hypothetical protein